MSDFLVKINGRDPQPINIPTGIYKYAVLAALYLTEPEDYCEGRLKPIHVEIWAPSLLPQYGPYHYLIEPNEDGIISAYNAVIRDDCSPPDPAQSNAKG